MREDNYSAAERYSSVEYDFSAARYAFQMRFECDAGQE